MCLGGRELGLSERTEHHGIVTMAIYVSSAHKDICTHFYSNMYTHIYPRRYLPFCQCTHTIMLLHAWSPIQFHTHGKLTGWGRRGHPLGRIQVHRNRRHHLPPPPSLSPPPPPPHMRTLSHSPSHPITPSRSRTHRGRVAVDCILLDPQSMYEQLADAAVTVG